MQRIKQIWIICFLSLTTCYIPHSKPKNLIEKPLFTKILSDIYLLQTLIEDQEKDTISKTIYYEKYKSKIFEKYSVNSTDFQESYTFYEYNLDTLLQIHKKIEQNYNKKINTIQTKDSSKTYKGQLIRRLSL